MTALPVARRELQVATRRPGAFHIRFAGGILATLLGGLFLAGASFPARTPVSSGQFLFTGLVYLGLIIALASGVLLTAPCISRERQDGTLGLLFLTDLGGWDVVTGKFIALAVVPIHGLLATVPIAALSFCLGGIMGGELGRAYVVLLNTLFLSLSLGLCISCLLTDERKSMGLSAGVLTLLCVLPELATRLASKASFPLHLNLLGVAFDLNSLASASPTGLLRHGFADGYRVAPATFWFWVAFQHLAAWVCLGFAAIAVRRASQDHESAGWEPRLGRPTSSSALGRIRSRLGRVRRDRVFREGPLAWHAWRGSWVWRGNWWIVLVTCLTAIIVFTAFAREAPRNQAGPYASAVVTGGFWLLKIFLVIHCTYFLNDACRSGALELILVTPVSSRQLCDGHLAAMRNLFTWPFLVLALVQLSAGVGGRWVVGGDWPSPWRMMAAGAVPSLLGSAVHALDLVAVAYYASRWALTYDRPVKAMVRTGMMVLLLPALICFNGRFLVDLIVIGQTRPILSRFRELARGWYFRGPAAATFGPPQSA